MKKLIALLLCLIMTVSVLVGCGPTAPTGGNNDETGLAKNTEATLPDDITLTIGIPEVGASVEDYDTNAYTLWLEEQTGYDLQFRVYQGTANDVHSQLSTAMVNEDELPDILIAFNLSKGVYTEYGQDDYFIDLAPYFEDKEGKAKIWWERFSQFDQDWQDYIWKQMVDKEDGGIYAFPTLESTKYDVIRHQAFINQDWLDKLGLPMPTDIESLYNTLVAFKTKDPNGNGKADEVPLIGKTGNFGDVVGWLINMFVYHTDEHFFRVDEQGKLSNVYTSDEYREALKFINKLVKEGLMPTSVWTLGHADIKSMLAPADGVQTVGIFLDHPSLCLVTDDENLFSYEAMPHWGFAPIYDQKNKYDSYVTEDCEYPDAAWNLLMLMCTEEGAYRMRYGEKGVDWVEADPNTVSYLGLPATIKVLNEGAFSNMGNQTWTRCAASIVHNSENEASQLVTDGNAWVEHKFKLMRECYEEYYKAAEKNPDNVIKVTYTVEEEEIIKTSRTNTKSWVTQNRASFCTGKGDLNDPNNDAQWDAYVKGFETQGYETWREVAESVYTLEQNAK